MLTFHSNLLLGWEMIHKVEYLGDDLPWGPVLDDESGKQMVFWQLCIQGIDTESFALFLLQQLKGICYLLGEVCIPINQLLYTAESYLFLK